jgi:hypothetical protein
MAPRIDPVILSALSLNPSTTSIATHGGSGFASTFKLIANSGSGQEKPFFVKTRSGDDAERMFAGEFCFAFLGVEDEGKGGGRQGRQLTEVQGSTCHSTSSTRLSQAYVLDLTQTGSSRAVQGLFS